MMWPREEPKWLVPWLKWHRSGRKGPRPNAPAKIPDWAWEVARWVEWRIQGGLPGQRPPISKAIQAWAWRVLMEVKPLDPPPPPSPSKVIPGYNILSAQTLYVCWGLDNGQYSVESLLRKGIADGYKSFALQATSANMRFFAPLQFAASQMDGVYVGLWEWATTADEAMEHIDRAGSPDFFDANIEHEGEWASYFNALRKEYPHLPLATSTTFWGFITNETFNDGSWEGDAKYAAALGVCCRPEAYLSESPNFSPERLHFTAMKLGWPHDMIFPLVSLYAGPNGRYQAEDYDLRPYAGWGAYSAEYLL
jgi:hypothetical protein